MTSVTINGVSLEYVERGSGETIVFVHGSVSDYRTWKIQQDELSKNYRTIAYSRRYHSPNRKIAEGADYSMTEQVDDLQALIRSLDGKPVHLVGNSYGAFLCLLLAIREPELIQTLVLAEPPIITIFIDIPPKPQQILKLLVTRPRAAFAVIKFAATGLNPATAAIERDDMETGLRLFGTAVLGRETFNQLSAARMEQVRENLIKAEFLGSGFSPLDAGEVSRVQIPTLLLVGARSQPLFRHLINRLYELLPHAEQVEIPAASHMSHEDNPSAYNVAVLAFIQRHPLLA
jgi:pimeloyl-ACP methyl ester carboxylesterase